VPTFHELFSAPKGPDLSVRSGELPERDPLPRDASRDWGHIEMVELLVE
jgi:hypothetical protein